MTEQAGSLAVASDARAASGAAPVLAVEHIFRSFGAVEALRDVSFDVSAGEVVALLGDNGAGKSTLVKIISGTIQPDSGHLLFDGRPVVIDSPATAKRLGIETVYQDLSICPNMDVVANFFMGRELYRNVHAARDRHPDSVRLHGHAASERRPAPGGRTLPLRPLGRQAGAAR
jgi:ABC-type sugar transport system ATPase subunit